MGVIGDKRYSYIVEKAVSEEMCVPLCGERLLINASFATRVELAMLVGEAKLEQWELRSMSYEYIDWMDSWYWSSEYSNLEGLQPVKIPFDCKGNTMTNQYIPENAAKYNIRDIIMIPNPSIDGPARYLITKGTASKSEVPCGLTIHFQNVMDSADRELMQIVNNDKAEWRVTLITCVKYNHTKHWYWTVTYHQKTDTDNFVTIPLNCAGEIIGELDIK